MSRAQEPATIHDAPAPAAPGVPAPAPSRRRPCRRRADDLELCLAVIAVVTAEHCPGRQWTAAELADVCGCAKQSIYKIERAALGKVRSRLRAFGITSTSNALEQP